ncbi:MAG: response regulator transcription factor [Nitrospiria bacterium]
MNASAANLPPPLQPPPAFAVYAPDRDLHEQVSYCTRAWCILSAALRPTETGDDPRSQLLSNLSVWRNTVDEIHDGHNTDPNTLLENRYISRIKSGRRQYGVRGVVIWHFHTPAPSKEEQGKHYLFMFERIIPDEFNLAASFRKWRLNTREQELVQLLLAGQSNLEIANHLNISINTVKGYLKLLMRKLGVNSRTKIISQLLTGKNHAE